MAGMAASSGPVTLTPALLGSFLPSAVLHNAGNGKLKAEQAQDRRCNKLSFSDDGMYLAGSFNDRTVQVIRSSDGKPEAVYSFKASGCQAVTFTHHSQFVLFAGRYDGTNSARAQGMLMYHSLYENKVVRIFKGHVATVTDIAMRPGSDTFLTSSLDGTFRLWDVRSPNCAHTGMLAYPSPTLPDGSLNKYVEAARGKKVTSGVLGRGSVGVDPSGQVFAVASPDHTVSLFDARNAHAPFASRRIATREGGSRVASSPHRPLHFQGLAFSADNRFLVAACEQHGCIVLDASPCEDPKDALPEVTVASTHGLAGSGCVMTPDSRFLVTGNEQGRVWAYDMHEMPQAPTADELAAQTFANVEYRQELKKWTPTAYPLGAEASAISPPAGVSVDPKLTISELAKHSGPVTAVAMHPSCALIASADSSVALWAPPPPAPPATLPAADS